MRHSELKIDMPNIKIDRSIHNRLTIELNLDPDIDSSLLDYPVWRQFRDAYRLHHPLWEQIKEKLLIEWLTGRPVTIFTTCGAGFDRQPSEKILEYDITWNNYGVDVPPSVGGRWPWSLCSSLFSSLFHEKLVVSIVQVDQCTEEFAIQAIRSGGFDINMTLISSSIPFADRKTVEQVLEIGIMSTSSSIPFADRDRKPVEEVLAHADMQDSDTSTSISSALEYELISCANDGMSLYWSNPRCGMDELNRIIRNITTQAGWDIDD